MLSIFPSMDRAVVWVEESEEESEVDLEAASVRTELWAVAQED
jgi:hypothetical protein